MDAATIVKRVRALTGITRKELAKLAGLSPSTIGRIEQGALDPTWGTLSRILEATGFRLHGDTVVSAGDQTAITAARPVLEPLLTPASAARTDSLTAPAHTILDTSARGIDRSLANETTATRVALASTTEVQQQAADAVANQWLSRWARAGWLSDRADASDVVSVAVSAGNAGKIARRNVLRRNVSAPGGWRELVRRLEEESIAYAVSGLVAARPDRATATAQTPVIYVADPALAANTLGLDEAAPGRGVLLLAPGDDGLTRTEMDGGIRFVSRAQGVLDAFAGSGREPDKAEDMLRSLLAVSA